MGFALPALAIGGALVSAAGTLEAGQARANEMNYRAQVAQNNAQIANQNAEYAINAGIAKGDRTSRKGAAVGGRIKAAQSANGVDVNTGSAAAVQESERETSKLDTETVISNAQLEAYGYRSQATGFTAESGLDREGADQARIGSEIGAAGSLLSNASSLGMRWSGGDGVGGFASGAGSVGGGGSSGWINPDTIPYGGAG